MISGVSFYDVATDNQLSTGNYISFSNVIPNDIIDTLNFVGSADPYILIESSVKNGNKGAEAYTTQMYLEVTYDDPDSPDTPTTTETIYLKQGGSWTSVPCIIYQKQNSEWALTDSTIFENGNKFIVQEII